MPRLSPTVPQPLSPSTDPQPSPALAAPSHHPTLQSQHKQILLQPECRLSLNPAGRQLEINSYLDLHTPCCPGFLIRDRNCSSLFGKLTGIKHQSSSERKPCLGGDKKEKETLKPAYHQPGKAALGATYPLRTHHISTTHPPRTHYISTMYPPCTHHIRTYHVPITCPPCTHHALTTYPPHIHHVPTPLRQHRVGSARCPAARLMLGGQSKPIRPGEWASPSKTTRLPSFPASMQAETSTATAGITLCPD